MGDKNLLYETKIIAFLKIIVYNIDRGGLFKEK